MALCKAKTEEDLNAILANALNSIIHHPARKTAPFRGAVFGASNRI